MAKNCEEGQKNVYRNSKGNDYYSIINYSVINKQVMRQF